VHESTGKGEGGTKRGTPVDDNRQGEDLRNVLWKQHKLGIPTGIQSTTEDLTVNIVFCFLFPIASPFVGLWSRSSFLAFRAWELKTILILPVY